MNSQSREVVAVIDVGSTSVRCSVAQLADQGWTMIDDVERPLELLHAIRGGHFSRANMDDLVRACADVLDVARSYGAARMRAVAGPSLKAVVNCDVLFEHIQVALGLSIEMIDGAEEGRLYYQALSWVLREERRELPGNSLMTDLGSTTSSVSLLRNGRLVHTVEDHFATHRVAFDLRKLKDTEELLYCIDRLARGTVRLTISRMGASSLQNLFVTGREPRYLRRHLAASPQTLLPQLSHAELDRVFEALVPLSPPERAEHLATDAHELPALLAALCFMRHLCGETGVDHLVVPELQLRLGLLMDFLPGALGPHRLPRGELVAAAEQLAARFAMDLDYGRNTATIALALFDATQPFHYLPPRARALLEFAALTHDIGAHINVRGRHKHTYHIIKSADIGGMSVEEREIVAQVARYHRGRPPQNTHADFMRLNREARALVSYLAAILRVAYSLDVDRTQRISRLRCQVEGQRFMLIVDSPNVVLERWALRDRAELFREVFGLDVSVIPERA